MRYQENEQKEGGSGPTRDVDQQEQQQEEDEEREQKDTRTYEESPLKQRCRQQRKPPPKTNKYSSLRGNTDAVRKYKLEIDKDIDKKLLGPGRQDEEPEGPRTEKTRRPRLRRGMCRKRRTYKDKVNHMAAQDIRKPREMDTGAMKR